VLFHETPVSGAYAVELEPRGDERGFFARVFCARDFAEQGLATGFVQVNTSASVRRGTLRGLHYQLPPSAEVKLVRCIRGALYDVVLDLRPDSSTFGRWAAAELTEENRRMLYVPAGCAHGFVTLEDDTEALYFVSAFYDSERERGVRWDDPTFAVEWPLEPAVLSPKDAVYPNFDRSWHLDAGGNQR
jgi:dTDP-4-dehydrorhamnose 3,5-epimerase